MQTLSRSVTKRLVSEVRHFSASPAAASGLGFTLTEEQKALQVSFSKVALTFFFFFFLEFSLRQKKNVEHVER